ncbi:4Fe-4S dicluster domain-containing protein [bacterium]|nr:4Fe-4S dicluster domain-containing protein [bacterium]
MEHNNRRYFKSLEELSNPSSVVEKEFLPETPGKNIIDEGEFDLKSSRRDFLKFMGFGISAATLAACTKTPVKKAIPYVIKPSEVDPGIPNYYASFYPDGGYGVLVKTREGRPIKIEGNDMDPLSLGGTTAAGQASVLSIYDEGRLHGPVKDGKPTTWDELDKDVYMGLRNISSKGGRIAILSEGINSPSTLRAIAKFKEAHPTTTHVQYDAVSYYGIRKAYRNSLGKSIIPSYCINKANTIVSFDADFLGTWLTPVAFTKQYSSVRDVTAHEEMAYHVQFESHLSLSGAKADLRMPCKPSEQGAAMVALYNALASKAGKSSLSNPGEFNSFITKEKIDHIADELWKNKGKGLVLCGANDENQQALAIEINKLIGSYGSTINTQKTVNLYNGNDEAMQKLVADMNAGSISALIVYGANPAYNYPEAAKFGQGLTKVELTVSLSDRLDETSILTKYVAPDNHWLESWNDFNPVTDQYSLSQPTIQAIFDTRQAQESILKWGKTPVAYYDFVKETWAQSSTISGMAFEKFWKQSLHDGLYIAGRKHSSASEAAAHTAETNGHGEMAAAATAGAVVVDSAEVTTHERVGVLRAAREVVSGENNMRGAVHDVLHGRENTEVVMTATAVPAGTAAADMAMAGEGDAAMTANTGMTPSGVDLTSVSSKLIADKNKASGTEVTLYQKTGIMDGRFSNNPWLLELPDSISKVSWDNYACVSPVFAAENGWSDGDLISVSANGFTIDNVPVLQIPGQLSGTISLALGYGRAMDAKAGRVANGVGINFYPFVVNGTTRSYSFAGAEIQKTGTGYELAKTQTHHHIQLPTGLGKKDRPSTAQRKNDIVKETSLGTLVAYRSNKHHGAEAHGEHGAHGHEGAEVDKVYKDYSDAPNKYKGANIYPDWKEERNFYKAIHWGMTVNLNTCTGCNACVIACQSENNIPVVGKSEVMRRREMHWIRIDRYYATTDRKEEDRPLLYTDNPSVMFQPLMCQHCDNAPCENVCPVNAINHSSEGINQQIYNRCMGTRYCANNCPYKVRRFNWFAYYDNDNFNYNFTMNSDLGRMVLNPDVTVRARGVMEKCSFCMQRIQAAKLVAKGENRAIKDGDVVTACQQACPANAITFGNTNDPEAKVSKVIEGDLSYRLVELLNTNNSVYYTTQVRNIKLESEMPVYAGEAQTEEAHS